MTVVWGKLFISILLSIICLISLHYKKSITSFLQNYPKGIYIYWFIFRLFPFFIIYTFYYYNPQSDVIFFYQTSGQALNGAIVYKDFWQPYSPLFPYLNAIPLLFMHSSKAILSWILLYELIAIIITRKIASAYQNIDFSILIYLILPAPFIFSVLGGQEDIMMWMFVSWSVLVYKKGQNAVLAGVILGIGLLSTKILLVIPLFILVLFSDRRIALLKGLLMVGIPAVVIMVYLVGDRIFAPLEIGDFPFAPNMISLLSPLIGGIEPGNKMLNWGGLFLILFGTSFFIIKYRIKTDYPSLILSVFILTHLITIIVHKNSLPNYFYIILLPLICFYSQDFTRKDWVAILILNSIAAVQPSLWYSLGAKFYTGFGNLKPAEWIDYGLQIIYITLSVYLLFRINAPEIKDKVAI
jgi:hypothetical protein